MLTAITRQVSPAITRCELTHLERQPIDLTTAVAQHHLYEQALMDLGMELISLPAEAHLPDSVFVEDTALVLDELAVLTRPGADSRKAEVAGIAKELSHYRELDAIQPPGTLDGGDILQAGRMIFIGISTRSNPEAIQQLHTILKPFGYQVKGVAVNGCLHLKSAVTLLAEDTLLINPSWVDPLEFKGFKLVQVDPGEPYAANILGIGANLLYQPCFPKTTTRLESAGYQLIMLDASELGKAEGALTCCSLIFKG